MIQNIEKSPKAYVQDKAKSRTSIVFPVHGTVKGSVDNVAKEEVFLCERLMHETSMKSNDFIPTKWTSHNNAVPSVIQGMKRPVCGLVALCMAGNMLHKHDPNVRIYENDEKILDLARSLGFSKQGEMFSANQYAELAERVLKCESRVISNTLANTWKEIFRHLFMGYPVLVPYDTDRNYEPCLRKGHKAHWAILTGFVIGHKKKHWKTSNNSPIIKLTEEHELDNIFNELSSQNTDLSLFYVYAKQGKSAKQQLWSFKSLSNSNANLAEVSPDRDHSQYEIPREGIEITLRSKIVLLLPKHTDESSYKLK